MTIKWNEYTWYSKLAAALFFILVLPTWTFYLGRQYEKTQAVLNNLGDVQNTETSSAKNAQHVRLVGVYKSEDTELDITLDTLGSLYIKGFSFFQGASAPTGQLHTGEIDGPLEVVGDRGLYSVDGCVINFTFSPNKVSAKDNNLCGGLNVSFTGDYTKE